MADLTTGNANVYYELGVRHAARPHTTIPICAKHHMPLPFDVAHVRSEEYDLGEQNVLTDAAANALQRRLEARLSVVQETNNGVFLTDSPVYQLLDDIEQPDIERLRSESFHERARYSTILRERLGGALRAAKNDDDLSTLHELSNEILQDGESHEAASWPTCSWPIGTPETSRGRSTCMHACQGSSPIPA